MALGLFKEIQVAIRSWTSAVSHFSVLSLYVPQILGRLVDDVIMAENTDLLKPLLLSLIAATLFRTSLSYILLSSGKGLTNVIHDIRTNTYERLNKQDFPFFDKNRTGDIMARMTGDMDAVRHL